MSKSEKNVFALIEKVIAEYETTACKRHRDFLRDPKNRERIAGNYYAATDFPDEIDGVLTQDDRQWLREEIEYTLRRK